MATLKELYTLVHALDKNEKRNLSIMIDALGGKARQRYANCLRVINEQQEYDPDKLKLKLSSGVTGMSLTEANGYFFSFICKALVSQHNTAPGNLGYLKELTLVETFISKGLFDMAGKHLQPLLVKLYNGNSFGLLIRAQELNSIISASSQTSGLNFKKRFQLVDQRTETARDHLQYLEVMKMNHRLTELVHTIGDARQKAHVQAYETIYKHPIWQTPYSSISKQTFIMFAPMKVDIINLAHGPAEAVKECRVVLEEFGKRFTVTEHYTLAFYILDSLVSDCIRLKDADAIAGPIARLQQLLPYAKHHAVQQKIQAKIMFSEISLEIIRGNYPAGVKKVDYWMQAANKITWQDAPLAYMNYLWAARVYYLAGDPDKALDYLLMIRGREKSFRASVLITYWFLHLMCYYKLNNHSLVSSVATSIYKSLLKHDKLYAPERALLRFTKSSGTVEKIKSNIQQLHTRLNELSTDPLNASFFQYGDYLKWLEMEMVDSKRKA